jgi:hypothetical protein
MDETAIGSVPPIHADHMEYIAERIDDSVKMENNMQPLSSLRSWINSGRQIPRKLCGFGRRRDFLP